MAIEDVERVDDHAEVGAKAKSTPPNLSTQ